MADKGPNDEFDMAKAVFWLVAFVIVIAMVATVASLGICVWRASKTEPALYESCLAFKARDFIAELLATVLVLLSAQNRTKK